MKKTFTSIIAILFTGALFAQTSITLNQGSYANLGIYIDTFAAFKSPYPQLTTGANQFWDLSAGVYENTKYYTQQYTGTNAAMPGASFYENTRLHKMGSFDSLKFYSKRWSGISATGFQRIGEETERTAIWLGQFAGFTSTDSMVVLKQNSPYPTPYDLIKFPATFNSSWNNSFDVTFNMEFTGLTYSHAPFVYKSHTAYAFTCPGWGKARVLNFDNTFGEAEVLMVRILGTTTDSFFLNGIPAPSGVLASLGLTQGKISNNNFDELFRPNEINALALYLYGADATFTNAQSAQVHLQRVPFAESVESVSADGSMSLYPNPVGATRTIFVKLGEAARGNYQYKVSNITGQQMADGNITAYGQQEFRVNLPAALANGVYWLTLMNAEGKSTVAPFRLLAE